MAKIKIKRGRKAGAPSLNSGELAYLTDSQELLGSFENEVFSLFKSSLEGGIARGLNTLNTGKTTSFVILSISTDTILKYSFDTSLENSIALNTTGETVLLIENLDEETSYTLNYQFFDSDNNPTTSLLSLNFTTELGYIFGPGPETLIAGNLENAIQGTDAGFFGQVSQAVFGRNMLQILEDLELDQEGDEWPDGINDFLLKFIHRGQVKFINKKPIWRSISATFIRSKINVVSGTSIFIDGLEYKVKLMRGFARGGASAVDNYSVTGTPNYETGPIFVPFKNYNPYLNLPGSTDWNPLSPNEWNILFFPMVINNTSVSSTTNVPTNWAQYDLEDFSLSYWNFPHRNWVAEEADGWGGSPYFLTRGRNYNIDYAITYWNATTFEVGMRLNFEVVQEG